MVLCSLYDASTTIQVPTYVNSNRLVSGKTPSESNVYDDLVALKSDYPENYLWDMTRSYISKELGTATGVEAFAYMLSDKVFGAMAASKLKDPADLRVGDVVSFDSGSDFGVVVSVDRNDFTYVTCDNSHKLSFFDFITIFYIHFKLYCIVKKFKYSLKYSKTCYYTILLTDKLYLSFLILRHN